jgi:hypothetical protein
VCFGLTVILARLGAYATRRHRERGMCGGEWLQLLRQINQMLALEIEKKTELY